MKSKNTKIILVIIGAIVLMCVCFIGIALSISGIFSVFGSSSGSSNSPESAVRAILVEAARGSERGIYSYTENGIDTGGDWPGDILYHCRGILIDKSIYLEENYDVEYVEDDSANVSLSTAKNFIMGPATFRVVLEDGRWLVSGAPNFFILGNLCD